LRPKKEDAGSESELGGAPIRRVDGAYTSKRRKTESGRKGRIQWGD